jgi:hypothetical protein
MYTVKKVTDFPVFQPGCQLANSPWPGIIKLILARGKGKPRNFFYNVLYYLNFVSFQKN